MSVILRAPRELTGVWRWVSFAIVPLALVGGLVISGCAGVGRSRRFLDIEIAAAYDRAGNPDLLAVGSALPRQVSWFECPAAIRCLAVRPGTRGLSSTGLTASSGGIRVGDQRSWAPGPTEIGTEFEIAGIVNRSRFVVHTTAWEGTVRAVSRPRVEGVARIGDLVTPIAARWVGGWAADPAKAPIPPKRLVQGTDGFERDTYFLNIEVCMSRRATGCTDLTNVRGYSYVPGPVRLPRWAAGRYVFAVSQRLFADAGELFGVPLDGGPIGSPPIRRGALLVRSSPIGPITG